MTDTVREEALKQCTEQGHDYVYIDGTQYRWDCQRCGWMETRSKPTLPLNPHGGWVVERVFADELEARRYAERRSMAVVHRVTYDGEEGSVSVQ